MGDIFEVQEILSSRQEAGGESEYKIRWKGFGPSEDTWEPEENLIHCEGMLNTYKNSMAEQSTRSSNRAPLNNTAVTSRLSALADEDSALADEDTSRSLTAPAKETEATPVLQKRRLRQRNTPKVQRILGVKHMPSQVNWSAVSLDKPDTLNTEQTRSNGKKISCDRPVRCNKWAILGGLLCILSGVLLLYMYLSMD